MRQHRHWLDAAIAETSAWYAVAAEQTPGSADELLDLVRQLDRWSFHIDSFADLVADTSDPAATGEAWSEMRARRDVAANAFNAAWHAEPIRAEVLRRLGLRAGRDGRGDCCCEGCAALDDAVVFDTTRSWSDANLAIAVLAFELPELARRRVEANAHRMLTVACAPRWVHHLLHGAGRQATAATSRIYTRAEQSRTCHVGEAVDLPAHRDVLADAVALWDPDCEADVLSSFAAAVRAAERL